MADKKISALTGATTPLAGTEVLPIVQSGATVKVAVSDLTAGRAVSAASFQPTSATVPTNGVFLGAANSVSIATNTTEHWMVNASGNLNPVGAKGIGTALAAVAGVVSTQYTSTVAIGTAPLVVTSTTNVANLNASSLNGATFAAPGAIGGGTASAITATTVNKVTITAPASASTLTIADGKTLTANNTLTLAGTDATTQTFPATSATIARTDAAQTFTGDQTLLANLVIDTSGKGLTTSGNFKLGLGANGSVSGVNITPSNNVLIGTTGLPFLYSETSNAKGITSINADTGKALSGVVSSVAASTGTADFDVSYFAMGFLIISNEQASDASARTMTTFSIFSRGGNNFTCTQIATANGTSGGMSFTVSWTGTSTIRITNTSASITNVYMAYFGT